MNYDPSSIGSYLRVFCNHLKSTHTRRQYRRDVEDLLSWMARVKGSTATEVFAQLDYEDMEAYLEDRVRRGAGSSTLCRARSAISSFYNHVGRLDLVLDNPFDHLGSMKRPKHTRNPPSVREVNDILDHVGDSKPFWPSRDQAIFELCYEGLPESDLIALDVADIDWAEEAVLRHSDRKKVPIGPLALKSLQIFVEERAARLQKKALGPDTTPALFIGLSLKRLNNLEIQGRIDPRTVCRVIQRIRPGWNARLLRDACGVHMFDKGAEDRIVAEQLGVELAAVDRLLKMATRERGETVMETHPRATLPAWDQVLGGEQISFPRSFFERA